MCVSTKFVEVSFCPAVLLFFFFVIVLQKKRNPYFLFNYLLVSWGGNYIIIAESWGVFFMNYGRVSNECPSKNLAPILMPIPVVILKKAVGPEKWVRLPVSGQQWWRRGLRQLRLTSAGCSSSEAAAQVWADAAVSQVATTATRAAPSTTMGSSTKAAITAGEFPSRCRSNNPHNECGRVLKLWDHFDRSKESFPNIDG